MHVHIIILHKRTTRNEHIMSKNNFNFITPITTAKINTAIINDGTPFPADEVKAQLTTGDFTSTDEYKEISEKKDALNFVSETFDVHSATVEAYGKKENITFKSSNTCTIAAKKYGIVVPDGVDKASYVAQQIKEVKLPIAVQYVEDNKELKKQYDEITLKEKVAKKEFKTKDGKKANDWINDTLKDAKSGVVSLNKKITTVKMEKPDEDNFEQLEVYNTLISEYNNDVEALTIRQNEVKSNESIMKFVSETKITRVLADKTSVLVSKWSLDEEKYLNSQVGLLTESDKARYAPRIFSRYAKKSLIGFGDSSKPMSKLTLRFAKGLFTAIYNKYAKDSNDAKNAGMFTPNVTQVSLKHFDQLVIKTDTPFDVLFNIDAVSTMNPSVAKEVANGFKERSASNDVYSDILKRVNSYIGSTDNKEFAAEFKDTSVRQVIAYLCLTFLNTLSKCVKANIGAKDRKITGEHFHAFLRPLYIIKGCEADYPETLSDS